MSLLNNLNVQISFAVKRMHLAGAPGMIHIIFQIFQVFIAIK